MSPKHKKKEEKKGKKEREKDQIIIVKIICQWWKSVKYFPLKQVCMLTSFEEPVLNELLFSFKSVLQ